MAWNLPAVDTFQRFEVYTGAGRRRSFTIEEKLALVAQMAGCGNTGELARRHHLRPSQLFTWRRELRYAAESAARDTEPPAKLMQPYHRRHLLRLKHLLSPHRPRPCRNPCN